MARKSATEEAPVKTKKKKKAVKPLSEDAEVDPSASIAETAAATAPTDPAVLASKKKKKKRPREPPLEEVVPAVSEEMPTVEQEAPAKKRKKGKRAQQASAETAGDDDAEASTGEKKSEPAKQAVDCTIFVDGVPYAWTANKVEQFFEQCGTITEVRAPTWQDSGRLRGFAHVTFADKAAAKKGLAMDGCKVDKKGRFLKIEAAKAEASSGPTVDLEGKRRLFVKNLPYDATEDEIGKLFSKCGKVREVRVPTSFGRSKGFAYVEFARSEFLKAAFDMKPELRGRVLRLDADSGSGPKAGFHYRPEAFDSSFAPSRKSGKGGQGKGGKSSGKGKSGKGGGPKKLSLFD
mmetsp:Transcript_90139/g.149354  ORF Transcript_90139/g.149354 Transcript_90139/m.149354 type:complete len:348 (+) Transcript_90139:73-1116(+)